MTRIDLVALQQRLAQQQPTPATAVPTEPPSWSTRPAPASALRTTPTLKARPATASVSAPAGTLRATTTMRAARAEERARVEALQTQVDELNAALVVANAEAARALAQEQARADRLSDRVDAMQRDLDAARADAVAAERRADATDTDRRVAQARLEHAEAARDRAEQKKEAERVRADALCASIDELRAGHEIHTCELAVARHDAHAARQAAAALRLAETERRARGLVARLMAAWRGE
jgi:chromosome segregation ATPase